MTTALRSLSTNPAEIARMSCGHSVFCFLVKMMQKTFPCDTVFEQFFVQCS